MQTCRLPNLQLLATRSWHRVSLVGRLSLRTTAIPRDCGHVCPNSIPTRSRPLPHSRALSRGIEARDTGAPADFARRPRRCLTDFPSPPIISGPITHALETKTPYRAATVSFDRRYESVPRRTASCHSASHSGGILVTTAFLSHSHADKEIARRLANDIRSAGIRVWFDEAELGIGDSLIHSISRAIDESDFLLVLLSDDSVKSQWVTREVDVALTGEIAGKNVAVLPLLVTDCEIPPFLRGRISGDFRDGANYQGELSRLLKRLGANRLHGPIVFDQSYQQHRWYAQPIVSAGYSIVAAAAGSEYGTEVRSSGYGSCDDLPARAVLIVPTPFGTLVDESHYANLASWVNRGGRLVMFGFYLMELHHFSNFNHLARRFGLEFAADLTMPRGHEEFRECMGQAFEYRVRDYWVQTEVVATPAPHPVLEGVRRLAVTSACTIQSAARPELVVRTSDPVAIMHARGYKNPEGRLAQLTDYVLEKHDTAPLLIAVPFGMGFVFAICTWKIFINDLVRADNDNLRLFTNLVTWLQALEANRPELPEAFQT
jgi:hypothetical protein